MQTTTLTKHDQLGMVAAGAMIMSIWLPFVKLTTPFGAAGMSIWTYSTALGILVLLASAGFIASFFVEALSKFQIILKIGTIATAAVSIVAAALGLYSDLSAAGGFADAMFGSSGSGSGSRLESMLSEALSIGVHPLVIVHIFAFGGILLPRSILK